jgi:RHS repeat-associated protein
VLLAKGYQPYGQVLNSAGSVSTSYGYTGEFTDASGLIYLRARYYTTQNGLFITKDTWDGDYYKPASYNSWLYAYSNPVTLTDPSGHIPMPSDYDETRRPTGVQFFPTNTIPLAQIYKNWVNATSYGEIVTPGTFGSQLLMNSRWPNLCGQVAIAALLRMTNSNITANEVSFASEAYVPNIVKGTSSYDLAELVNNEYRKYWYANYQGNGYWTDYTGHNRYQLLPYSIRNWLASAKYPLFVVRIACGDGGIMRCGRIGKGAKLIQHWVVVTGISANWDEEWWSSNKDWVRIFNPFDNQTEYYTYEDFKWGITSTNGGGPMLLMERKGPRMPKPPRRSCYVPE